MHFNLLRSNRQTDRVLEEVRDVNPDLVVLHEYAPHWHDAVLPVLGPAYPHVRTGARPGSYGWAIYSRFPIVGEPAGAGPARSVSRDAGPGRTGGARHPRSLVRRPPSGRPRTLPVLVCNEVSSSTCETCWPRSDFRCSCVATSTSPVPIGCTGPCWRSGWWTPTNRPARAGARPGRSSRLLRYVPGIRIDHIYLRGGLTCLEAHTGIGAGSDHRPVIAEIAMPAQPRRRAIAAAKTTHHRLPESGTMPPRPAG